MVVSVRRYAQFRPVVLSMNVDQLCRILANLPGHLPVVVEDSSAGWMQGAGLYLAPAHFDRRVSGTYLYASHQAGSDDCEAL
jgi:hypothetical protein